MMSVHGATSNRFGESLGEPDSSLLSRSLPFMCLLLSSDFKLSFDGGRGKESKGWDEGVDGMS